MWAIGVDVTERKEAFGKLRKARDELEARVRERTAELETANERLRRQVAEQDRFKATSLGRE